MREWPQRPRDDHPTTDVVAYDIETIVDHETADGSFPPIHHHRPVAAAFLRATWSPGERYDFCLDVPICHAGEEAAFYAEVNRCLPTGVVGIGLNTRGFDHPVLRLQAWRHRQFSLPGLARQTQAGRYENVHLDLADALSGYGGSRTPSLAAICDTLEIPVKVSAHGSQVGALWAAGEVETVRRYVSEDVLCTYIVALHLFAWKAGDPKLLALPLADLGVWIEQTPGLEHLRPFATCPPARWARQAAVGMRADIAREAAERRLIRERDEAAFSA